MDLSAELFKKYAEGQRDFEGINLAQADLSGADLSGINLSKANLAEADLSGANLSHANCAALACFCSVRSKKKATISCC